MQCRAICRTLDSTLDTICRVLDCSVGDILEYRPDASQRA